MQPQLGYLTCIHSAQVYHSLAAVQLENDGEFIGFIGDHTPTRFPIPIKLPLLASFEWKQLNAGDNPGGLDDDYKDQPPGQLWAPDATEQRTQTTIPCLLTLPMIGFKIFLSLGSKVMPHELRAAIKQYLASNEMELANDNSWGLVLDWLLCTAQAENGKSLIALLLELVVTAEEEEFHDWMTMRLNTMMGTLESDMTAHPQGQTGLGGGQGHTSAGDMGAIIGCSIVAVVQTLTPTASGAGGGTAGNEAGMKDKYSPDKVAVLMGFAHVNPAHKLPQYVLP